MANIISNIIRLGGENPDLERVKKFVKSDDLIFDFNRIIPVPSNIKDDYRWKIAHWGTASNTSSDNTECEDYEFRFWTRWTAPIQVIAELASMFPDVEFTHIFILNIEMELKICISRLIQTKSMKKFIIFVGKYISQWKDEKL